MAIQRPRRGVTRPLTSEEEWDLLWGDSGGFPSDAARREAWHYHRARLVAESHAGERPAAFWDYVIGEKQPWPVDPRDDEAMARWGAKHPEPWTPEAVRLRELGGLTEEEIAELDRKVRGEWPPRRERATAPGPDQAERR